MKKQLPPMDKERGAVLLTTLLLMTILVAVTVSIVDNIRFSIRRAASVQQRAQLDWYVRGGEEFAESWLQKATKKQNQISSFIRLNEPIAFPFDGGGIGIRVYDARNCFNLNTLAVEKNGNVMRREFETLLSVLDFERSKAETIAASIQDWVDDDSIPASAGAESLAYANLQPAYQVPNRLLVDISELREIQGIDEETYQRLLPFVCVVADMAVNRLNLNTLTQEQAPLLASILGGEDGYVAAQTVIAERPSNGYTSVDQAWDLPAIQDLELKGVGKDKVDIKTDMIGINMLVNYQEQSQKQRTVFVIGGVNDVQLVSRRTVY